MRVTALALAVAMMAATTAFAQTDPVAPPPAETSAEPGQQPEAPAAEATRQDPDEEVICRTVQRAESRLRSRRERVCGTRTQWEQMEDQNARDARNIGSVPAPSPQ